MTSTKMQRRIRIAGTLVSLGMIVELISLLWTTPTAFILFLIPGAILIVAGILFYLYSLVSVAESPADEGITEPVI